MDRKSDIITSGSCKETTYGFAVEINALTVADCLQGIADYLKTNGEPRFLTRIKITVAYDMDDREWRACLDQEPVVRVIN